MQPSDRDRCAPHVRRASRRALLAMTGVGFFAIGCIPSNVVAHEDRAILSDVAALEWSNEPVTSLDGLFESVELLGEAAAQLWKIYYVFEPSRYTAAALVEGDDGLLFQTLAGRWSIGDGGGLVLDDADPVLLRRSVDGVHLRIDAGTGSVVLRHVELR